MVKNLLVTGGMGFIGSHLIRYLINKYPSLQVINFDDLTYAANPGRLESLQKCNRYDFCRGNLCDIAALDNVFAHYSIDGVIHLAAETNVDSSIQHSSVFFDSNAVGTKNLLEVTQKKWKGKAHRFLHISTDEVYGSLSFDSAPFTERSPLSPSSPYSASKAASDLWVLSFFRTYGMNISVINASNNYGLYQHPEKLIPKALTYLQEGRRIPIYGTGENVRDWLHVDDHVRGIEVVFQEGKAGERYNVGSGFEVSTLQVCRTLVENYKKEAVDDWVEFVEDRPGHDLRYALDCRKIQETLGWKAQIPFERGIQDLCAQWPRMD